MFYIQPATSLTPALVIYLVDASPSMNEPCSATTKIDMVNKALRAAIKDMVRRSMHNGIVDRRYKIAIFAYRTRAEDILGGIRELPDIIKDGVPVISADSNPDGKTDMIAGFTAVEKLLQDQLVNFQDSPAPLVCHLTDGLTTGEKLVPVVCRIQAMAVNDGSVLVENVYVADNMLRSPVQDWRQWHGVTKLKQLTNNYAKLLFQISSPLPETYCQNINYYGYDLRKGAAFLLPGTHTGLVRVAFPISKAIPIK
jgi:von Willebrand factor type A domain